jgi:hypothetical protein
MDSPLTKILSVSPTPSCLSFFKATYSCINGVHNFWGLVASADMYLHHYGTPFLHPATRTASYDPANNMEASCIDRICTKTTWAALIQDYETYVATERSAPSICVGIANITIACYPARTQLKLKNLPSSAHQGHFMPSFPRTLVSIAPICNTNLTVSFTKHDVKA